MTYDLLTLVNAIERVAKRISQLLQDPPLKTTQAINATGDLVKEIDVQANKIFIEELSKEQACGGLASEELTDPIITGNQGKHLVFFDPIDGSSNVGFNTVGSIFSIVKIKNNDSLTEQDFLQSGKNIILAGYVLYGSETIMVLASHGVVKQYHLEDEFVLRQENIKCPAKGPIVSVNAGNYRYWNEKTVEWFDRILEYGKSIFRYSGSACSDIHKILLHGGIFAYPFSLKSKKAKIRLLFEAAPLSFIVNASGGLSLNEENKNILDISPTSLHQTVSFFTGSKENILDFIKN